MSSLSGHVPVVLAQAIGPTPEAHGSMASGPVCRGPRGWEGSV